MVCRYYSLGQSSYALGEWKTMDTKLTERLTTAAHSRHRSNVNLHEH